MTELVIPEGVDDEFKELYQELIRSSLLRVAGEDALEPRRRGFLRRHRSGTAPPPVVSTPPTAPPASVPVEAGPPEAEAPAREAPDPSDAPEHEAPAWPAVAAAPTPPAAGAPGVVIAPATGDRRGRLRLVTKILWAVAVVLLVCDALAFGITSWATGIADVAVLVLSVVWFLLSSDRMPEADIAPVPAASRVEPIAPVLVEAEPEPAPVAAVAPSGPVTVTAAPPSAVAERIDGLRVVLLPVARDAGGHVTELVQIPEAAAAWRVVSCQPGTLRGMHALVRSDDVRIVVDGKVALGLKDLRPGSPTHGNAELLELSGEEHTAVLIPRGVAHGLFAHSNALVLVAVTAEEEDEYGCAWNDPGLGIEWPGEPQYLSERDRRAGPLATLAEELAARLTRST